jgi:SNF2 family DNA or RNA helicase
VSFRPYQQIAFDHFAQHPRCALWAGMGLGKTYTSLAFVDALDTIDCNRTLVLAPKRVARSTWPDEAKKWGYDEVVPIIGSAADRMHAVRNLSRVNTINYENIPWLIDALDGRWPFETVVADESTRLKGFRLKHGGKRTAVLAKVAAKSQRFIELTGTPASNGLIDLWGQMWFIDQGQRLGRTFTAFKERWFRTAHNGFGVEPLPHAFDEITSRCKDVCLSINAADWFDLEEPIVTTLYVDLPKPARLLYREVEKQMFAELQGRNVTAVNAAAKSGKLLQIANGAVYLDPLTESDADNKKEWKEVHDEKIEALRSLVEEQAGAPLLVAYHFKSDLARLRAALPQARTLDDAPDMEQRWNLGQVPVLLVHPASAGHGLNLQYGGNAICFFGNWWNLEERLQVIERIGPVRQAQAGFKRPVFIYVIVARDTVDEVVVDRVQSKKSVQDALLDYMKRRLR